MILHRLDDLPLALPFLLTNGPRMITSELRISLQHLALHASKIPLCFHRFRAIDHGLSIARLKGRAKQDSDEVLDAKGVQLTYRHLKTIQHTDDNFGNREPQAAVHYECFVTSKVTLRGNTSLLSLTRNPKFHRIRNLVERLHDPKKLASAPTWCTFFDQMMVHNRERLLIGRCNRTITRNPPYFVLSRVY
ncbi:hypothetical protein IGI04_023598 [Brassica rapa subsp. trilocularis]|uniref:Uncharacterized protein n=1 Tax=Brassica rapa subsp. trilocularis TaxID=1813537 RepID=A0ABQ7M5S2_BRACM|nr:hypothetical protein IGI04_023598 [Brassica rapa subsp. trilocularis]